MTDETLIDQYLESHLDELIAELARLTAQPSVAPRIGV